MTLKKPINPVKRWKLQYEDFQNRYGLIILFGLIIITFVIPQLNIFGVLIGEPTTAITRLLLGI